MKYYPKKDKEQLAADKVRALYFIINIIYFMEDTF